MRPKAYPLLLGTRNRPAIDWNFAGSGSLPAALTFSRASLATMYDASGTLVWCPHNLLTYSEALASWGSSGAPARADGAYTATLPSGEAVSLTSITEPSGAAYYLASNSSSLSSGQTHTVSAVLRAVPGGRGWGWLAWDDSAVTKFIYINLSTGALGSVSSGVTADAPVSLGGGAWLVTFRYATTTGVGCRVLIGSAAADGAWNGAGDGRLSIAAGAVRLGVGTQATYARSTSAAYYGPRLTYDPVTHAALGLLVEEQRTNLLTYSEALDNAAWAKNGGASITANVATAPDGYLTADRLTVVTGASDSLESPGVSITSGTAYTATARLLLGTSTTVTLNMSNAAAWSGGVNPAATFNLSTGAMTGVAANTTAKVEALAGGWFSVSITATAAVTTTTSVRVVPVSSSSTTIVWGLQLEAGAVPTSYIPTTSASATRAADVVTCSGAAFSGWVNAAEGTLVVEGVMPNANIGTAAVMNMVYIGDGPGNEYIKVYQYETYFGAAIRHGGALQADISSTKTAGAVEKLAIAWAVNDAAVAIRGAIVGTDATVAIPTGVDRLTLGTGTAGAVAYTIKRIRYWPRRLTNAQLQALTA